MAMTGHLKLVYLSAFQPVAKKTKQNKQTCYLVCIICACVLQDTGCYYSGFSITLALQSFDVQHLIALWQVVQKGRKFLKGLALHYIINCIVLYV